MRVLSFRWSRTVTPPEPGIAAASTLIAVSGLGMVLLLVAASRGLIALSPLTWYLIRASGLTLYLLLWLATLLGLGLSTTLFDRFGGRGLILSLHAYATRLAYGFLALHLAGLVGDRTVHYGLREVIVPFAAGWREPWTGAGVVAMWLFLITGLSFGARRLTGYRAWRALHWLTSPLYLLSLAHGVGAGSDTRTAWGTGLYLVTGMTVGWLLAVRLARGRRRPSIERVPQPARPETVAHAAVMARRP